MENGGGLVWRRNSGWEMKNWSICMRKDWVTLAISISNSHAPTTVVMVPSFSLLNRQS